MRMGNPISVQLESQVERSDFQIIWLPDITSLLWLTIFLAVVNDYIFTGNFVTRILGNVFDTLADYYQSLQ